MDIAQKERILEVIEHDATGMKYLRDEDDRYCVVGALLRAAGCQVPYGVKLPSPNDYHVLFKNYGLCNWDVERLMLENDYCKGVKKRRAYLKELVEIIGAHRSQRASLCLPG